MKFKKEVMKMAENKAETKTETTATAVETTEVTTEKPVVDKKSIWTRFKAGVKKGKVIIATVTGVGAGIVGTLLYQKATKKDDIIIEDNVEENVNDVNDDIVI